MTKRIRRLLALCLCFASVVGYILTIAPLPEANAAVYSSYTTIAKVPTQSPCSGMQGMDMDGTYIYCAKVDDDTTACIARVHKDTGALTWLTNAATGTKFFSHLYHANDLAVCTVNGVKTLFVGTGGAGKGAYSLVRLTFDGTTLKEVAHYDMQHNGSSKYMAGVKVVATSSTEISLILKQGNYVYSAKIPYDAPSGAIAMEYVGKLDFSAVDFGGTIRDLSGYVVQGFGYKDHKLFVPMTANYQTSTSHISSIVCFDIHGIKNGNLKPDPSMSVWIEDTTYPHLFEIESCAICPTDGKLYFGTNGRKSTSDSNHDGIHVLNGFVYDPTMGDPNTDQNYYFVPSAGTIKSVTTGASVYNSVVHHLGQVSSSKKITGGRWSLDMPIILKHDQPWVLTWESSNWTGNSLLLSTYDTSGYSGNRYLYRRSGSGLIALGYQGNGEYHNYGVLLSDHGIDDTKNHVYSLRNEVNSDGTNMVYLWVDSTRLGAMNNYYIGGDSQKKTNNWVSGKDFTFSYMGTTQHPVAGTLQYMKVWTKGNINAIDEPNVFRWEPQSNKMTAISQFGYNTNALTVLGGSCTNNTFSNYYGRLEKPVVLMHDRPWVMEWKTSSWSGNTMLFSSGERALMLNASYLYRSTDTVCLGYSDGTKCHSYGIKLTDHGISTTGAHTYRLTNKINADGTNMVYLSVDGQELGPMNRYYLGSEYQGTTTNWVSGKDYTFAYMGNYQYGLNQPYDYIQVWENGIPSTDTANRYRWEGSGSTFKNITSDNFAANTANRVIGSISNSVFSEAAYRLNTPIVLKHDQPWSVSWQSSGNWTGSAGGAFLLSASLTNGELNAPYIYRRKDSEMIGIGFYNGSRHVQYGITLSDHGIDGVASHTYTLRNRINYDGSNMVYLSVDGKELGAMNNYYVGGSAQGTTSNWISGKDFTFAYMGTPRFPLSNVTINYLEINEGCIHSYTDEVTTAPTCVSAGVRTYTCSLCGNSYTESIAAVAHSYKTTVTAPTCTAAGYTTYTCTVCGDSYTGDTVASGGHKYVTTTTAATCTTAGVRTYTCNSCSASYTESIPATGHTLVQGVCTVCGFKDAGYVAPDYYLFGYINDVNYACEENYEDMGSYKFVNGKLTTTFSSDSYVGVKTTGNGSWYMTDGWQGTDVTSVTLYNTNNLFSADKLFVPGNVTVTFTLAENSDGSLTLSYTTTSTEPSTAPTIALKYPTVSFEDVIVMNIYYSATDLEDVTEMGLITYSKSVANPSLETAEHVVPGYAYDGTFCISSTAGIAPKDIGDTIYFAVYYKLADGTCGTTALANYSPKTYAMNVLSGTATTEMKTLVVAMLNYGAAAQTYFNYKTDSLVNASLTSAQKALVKSYSANMVADVTPASGTKLGEMVNNGGYVRRYPTISFEGAFRINYYFVPSKTPVGDVTMYVWNMEDYNAATSLRKSNATKAVKMELTANGEYMAVVDGIAAKNLDKAVYVSFCYSDGTTNYCDGVTGYTIGVYCKTQAATTGNMANLAKACAVYGYYAKEMFY